MAKVILGVKGTDFTWNGQRRQLHMASSFGWLGLMWNRRYKEAKQWLERMAGLGMHGIRVFGEYRDWQHNFFFSQVSPLYDVWDWNARRGSLIVITKRHEKMLSKAIEFLQEFDMVMEYAVSATVKAFSTSVVSGYRGHMCRAIAQWFAGYEQFHGATNTLFEIENEYDTVEPKKRLTVHQMSEIARRFRVSRPENHPDVPDYPGSLISVSEGGEGAGEWEIEYDPTHMSHINIHSPRGRDWEHVSSDIKEYLERYRKPVYLNENMHYMSKAEWAEWVNKDWPTLEGLSTKSHRGIIRQAVDAFEAGASYCMHFMTGMLTDPGRPKTYLEEAWREAFNPTAGTLPPPAPPVKDPPKQDPEWKELLYAIWRAIKRIW